MRNVPTMDELEREDQKARRRLRAIALQPKPHMTADEQRESRRYMRRMARSQWSAIDHAFFQLQQQPGVEYVTMTFGKQWSWGKPVFSIELHMKNGETQHLVVALPLRYALDEALAKIREDGGG